MKPIFNNILTLCLFSVLILPLQAMPDQIGTWEKLGSRKVNFKTDRDEIMVTRRDGRFRKIKLEVDKGSVNFHECIVVFGDGKRQNVRMKKVIHEGQSTRVIDLQGGRRIRHSFNFSNMF